MGLYQVGNKWYVDLYVDGRRKRKAIGSRKEAENALTAIKADVLRGELKFKGENCDTLILRLRINGGP